MTLSILKAAILLSAAVLASGRSKPNPRVFVTDSKSWEIAGGFGGREGVVAGVTRGGARPQTAEIMKTVRETCEESIVTIREDNADYILLLEHEGGKGFARKDNKWVLFKKNGDAIGSGSTRALGNAVKDACKALVEDWGKAGSKGTPPRPGRSNPAR